MTVKNKTGRLAEKLGTLSTYGGDFFRKTTDFFGGTPNFPIIEGVSFEQQEARWGMIACTSFFSVRKVSLIRQKVITL